MDWSLLLKALGLMLVIEGISPFISPFSWKKLILKMATTPNHKLRIYGLISMLAGLLLIYVAHA
ncbi:MAG: hypothetical protein COW84_02445 [Gammaproteobacteria bacterium CG22_combo_CG10-13_8_21_14_all_40_8]|nr:MAG: hypothetical protein COW84_02445 [Gammaproteobacteria bacterium CG22_combo_CG10-13_8_21_14_all_40_8]